MKSTKNDCEKSQSNNNMYLSLVLISPFEYFCSILFMVMYTDLFKNFAKLFSANVIAQLIGILIYPVLTRLYSPEDFGFLNLFMVIGGLATIVSTLEFQNAVMLPTSDKYAVACVHVGAVATAVVVSVFFCLTPFADAVCQMANVDGLASSFWMLPLFILAMASWNLLNMWYTRLKLYNVIAGYNLGQSVVSAAAKCCLSFIGGLGIIVGTVFAPILSLVAIVAFSWKHSRALFCSNWTDCVSAANRYSNFYKFSLARSFGNYLSSNLIILILSAYFDMAEMGMLGLALTLSFRPVSLVSSSMNQVLFQHVSERKAHDRPICECILQPMKTALIVIVPLFIIASFFLPQVCSFVFGDEWRQVGSYICYMLPWIGLSLIGGSVAFVPDVFMQQKKSMFIEVAYLIARACCLFCGVWMNSIKVAVILYSLVGVFFLAYQIQWYLQMCKSYDASLNVESSDRY